MIDGYTATIISIAIPFCAIIIFRIVKGKWVKGYWGNTKENQS